MDITPSEVISVSVPVVEFLPSIVKPGEADVASFENAPIGKDSRDDVLQNDVNAAWKIPVEDKSNLFQNSIVATYGRKEVTPVSCGAAVAANKWGTVGGG